MAHPPDVINRLGASTPSRDEYAASDRALVAAYEAALAIASDLDLPAVLQRIVDLARNLAGAKYCALSVTDWSGAVQQFITSGITREEREAIGDLPTGKGLLGELSRRRMPLLIEDMSADPRSAGFPPNHPPMKSLLGVPIVLGPRTLGNLYLSEREDGQPFDEGNLHVVQVMAAHAASAIDRAAAYRQAELSRQHAEEQRDQLRVILDSLPAGVLIQSQPDGSIELANNAAMAMLLGPVFPSGTLPSYGRDFIILQDDEIEMPAGDRPGDRALRGETLRNRQMIVQRRDGQKIPVLVQAGPLRDASGEVNRAVAVIQDITQLRQAEQLKDDFISLISHELRTPITSVYGGAHLLANQGEALDNETRIDLLADIVSESERLNQMLSNLISLASIQAGRLEPDTEPVLLAPLATAVSHIVARRSPRHHFTVEIPAGTPPVEADPSLLEQVLRNLYENAVKYSPDGGAVQTTATVQGNRVLLQVTDEGIGIAPASAPELFERFRRPGAPPTVRGMGLGLYLSRFLVTAQGGHIAADSPGPGLGATFTVTLPIATGWQAEASPQDPPQAIQ